MERQKPFIMKDTIQCEKALKHWLMSLQKFNSYSHDGRIINLFLVDKPDSDWGKILSKSGSIVCIEHCSLERALEQVDLRVKV